MITEYIQAAMRKAKYEILENNEGFYGEIPGFQGVWGNGPTLEGCREDLAEALEEWILFQLSDNTPLPKINGINLRVKKVSRQPALI
jgi:predicted RNase H-like HicB family nuclease